MKKVYTCAGQLIGNTPMLEAVRLQREMGLQARLLLKLEGFNPGGSSKDRVGDAMIRDAERRGILAPGSVIIEPTSGNTGIGLCVAAAVRGYRTIIVMPDNMSMERRLLMKAYGAELVLTPGSEGMKGAIAKAQALCQQIPGSFIPGQFDNSANPQAHYDTTGPEIFEDTHAEVDIFVAGVGTGGTITGVGRYLKEKKPQVRIVAVEPASSPLLTRGWAAAHGIQGIGANFVPAVLDRSVIDEIICVTDEDAMAAGRMLSKKEGVLIGISSGACLHAAIELAKKRENAGKTIVALMPDSGERYLSTDMYRD